MTERPATACCTRNDAFLALQRKFVELARRPPDWDSHGAAPADPEAIAAAQALVIDVVTAFPDRGLDDVLPSDVLLLPTGTVQVVWEEDRGKLDLDIDAARTIGYLLTIETGDSRCREERGSVSLEEVIGVLADRVGLSSTANDIPKLGRSEQGVISMPVIEGVRFIDQHEGMEILDENAKGYLGISGEEFLKRWDAGDYDGKADTPEIMRVVSLIHLAR